ncbi:hypothetical protein [Paenimyroides baculatum]|uniref:Uncharacterized protein n=1 Tax=Paenimyroides baculatum TaxID=2608000 RepID=A0A5M6C9G5_9FLAO|nr:hypothetical protein [Paenimyroides baculatum]KAA5531663.1 hypothetical protein F0460_15620 [Paenimyroides baculatum]
MKTRIDKTIPSFSMVYGMFFILLFLFSFNLNQITISIFWLFLGVLIMLFSLWRIGTFLIIDDKLIKSSFLCLYKKTINLKDSFTYNKKIVNMNHFNNPLNIIKWFSNDNKYFIFRKVSIVTQNGRKITIDERSIKKEDFNILYKTIKSYKKHQS